MIALGPHSRAVLGLASLASFAAAFSLAPLNARSEANPMPPPIVLASPRTAATAATAVVARRDPFDGGEPAGGAAAVAATPSGDVPRPLPPNRGAQDLPSGLPLGPPQARVTAVATGAHPSALLEEAGQVRLVTVGDRVGAASVSRIDAGGVHLSDGSVLALQPDASTSTRTPPPSRFGSST